MQVTRAKKADYSELMDFMHRSFLTAKPRHSRFEKLYPDMYRPSREAMDCHRIIRQEGTIVASLGIFPIQLRMDNVVLDVAGLGGVCTAPEFRRQGLMAQLAQGASQLLHRDGCPLSWLSSDRNRYAPFGYEKAGSTYQALLTAPTHSTPDPAWTIQKVNPENADIDSIMEGLQLRNATGMCDPVTFRLKLKRLRNELWEARTNNPDNPRFAFLVTLPQVGWIAEWGGDPTGVDQLLNHCLEPDSSWHMHLPSIADAYTDLFASRVNGQTYHLDNLAIFSLEGLLRRYEPYLVEHWPRKRTITFILDEKRCSLVEGRLAPEPSKGQWLRVDRLKLSRILFGPDKPSQHLDLTEDVAWLDEVLPLPFYMPWLFRV